MNQRPRARRVFSCALAAVAAGLLTLPMVGVPSADAETIKVGVKNVPPGRGNPYTGRGIPSVFTWSAIFDRIVELNDTGVAMPGLATSWEVKDDLTWHFKLRRNVTFSNGEPFNAQALKVALDWLATEKGQTTAMGRTLKPAIASVRAIDDMTLEIKTPKPFPILEKRLSAIAAVAPKAWMDRGVEGFSAKPEGTGSYRLVEFKPEGAEVVGLPNSWKGIKDVDRIIFLEIGEGVPRAQGIISGQIDIDVGPSLDLMPQVVASGAGVFTFGAPRTLGLTIVSFRNGKQAEGPWADRRVRQAANYAVNKQAIVDHIYGGRAKIASQAATTNAFGYDPGIKPYPYDPDKARALLAEAGYPNGFDTEVRTTVTDPTFVNVWESAVADLNAVGIRADYVAQAFPEWLKHWLAGDWPYDLFGIGHDLTGELDASQSFTSFSSCLKNPPYYCNEEEMPLVNAMITEMDSKKREQMLHELLRINAENAPIIFLTEGIEAVTYNSKIKNLKVVNLIINYHELEIAN